MSDRRSAPTPGNEMTSALFANLVLSQANLALMLLGREPNPETGQLTRDLAAARVFIDQLEMLEIKTRGNLEPTEQALLKQTLMNLRMEFVQAAEEPAPAQPAASTPPASAPAPNPSDDDESRKRFTKKY
jgi:hypothetical protein